MFSATVAQKPTMPVSAGTKKRRNAALSRNRLGGQGMMRLASMGKPFLRTGGDARRCHLDAEARRRGGRRGEKADQEGRDARRSRVSEASGESGGRSIRALLGLAG